MTNKIICYITISATLFLTLLFITPVSAHPGRTAADGCHYCRTNCDRWGVPWGERHCHGGGSVIKQTPRSTPTPFPTTTPTSALIPSLTSDTQSETLGTQTQSDSGSFWTGLITLGLLGGGLYWVIKKIKTAFNKDNEENKKV